MGIIGYDLTLILFSMLRHHRDNLKREVYTEQTLRIGRLVVDMRGVIGNN